MLNFVLNMIMQKWGSLFNAARVLSFNDLVLTTINGSGYFIGAFFLYQIAILLLRWPRQGGCQTVESGIGSHR